MESLTKSDLMLFPEGAQVADVWLYAAPSLNSPVHAEVRRVSSFSLSASCGLDVNLFPSKKVGKVWTAVTDNRVVLILNFGEEMGPVPSIEEAYTYFEIIFVVDGEEWRMGPFFLSPVEEEVVDGKASIHSVGELKSGVDYLAVFEGAGAEEA